MIRQVVFLVDAKVALQKYRALSGILESVLPTERMIRIGNCTPLIVTAMGESAKAVAVALSKHYRRARVHHTELLEYSYTEVFKNYQRIWNSLCIPNMDKYKFAFLIIEEVEKRNKGE